MESPFPKPVFLTIILSCSHASSAATAITGSFLWLVSVSADDSNSRVFVITRGSTGELHAILFTLGKRPWIVSVHNPSGTDHFFHWVRHSHQLNKRTDSPRWMIQQIPTDVKDADRLVNSPRGFYVRTIPDYWEADVKVNGSSKIWSSFPRSDEAFFRLLLSSCKRVFSKMADARSVIEDNKRKSSAACNIDCGFGMVGFVEDLFEKTIKKFSCVFN